MINTKRKNMKCKNTKRKNTKRKIIKRKIIKHRIRSVKNTKRKIIKRKNKFTKNINKLIGGMHDIGVVPGMAEPESAGVAVSHLDYTSLKDLSFDDFKYEINSLFTSCYKTSIDKDLFIKKKNIRGKEVLRINSDIIDRILDELFNISRISSTGAEAFGIYLHNTNSNLIVKVYAICSDILRGHCKNKNSVIDEIYWQVKLYNLGLSPQIYSIFIIKIEDSSGRELYLTIVMLKKHKTFREYYRDDLKLFSELETQIDSIDDYRLRDKILSNEKLNLLFNNLIDRFNYHRIYLGDDDGTPIDLHLNNIVMNESENELLVIDTIATENDHRLNDMNVIGWMFA